MNTPEQHKQVKAIAWQCLTRHDHKRHETSQEVRENCGACTLNGYHPKGERRDFINYAGWARIYIEAGKFIPNNLQFAFLAELASDNRAYAEALKEDIREFGINSRGESFRRAIQDVLGIYE